MDIINIWLGTMEIGAFVMEMHGDCLIWIKDVDNLFKKRSYVDG